MNAQAQTYRVIRYYRSGQQLPEVTHRGLTEEQALGIVGCARCGGGVCEGGTNGNPHAPYFSVYQAEAIE